jgi:uncharacterized protein (TIRG00374 family)
MSGNEDRKGGIEHFEKRLSQTLLLVFPTIVVIFLFIFRETDLTNLIKRINFFYLFLLSLLLIGVWFFNTLKFYMIVKFSGGKVSFKKSFEIVLASVFGSNITPFYSGGIPTQVYFLSKFAESIGRATAISVLYMILTLLIYLVFSVILLVTPHGFISGLRNDFFTSLAVFVFVLSSFAFFFMRFPYKAKRIIEKISNFFSKGKFDPSNLEKSIDEFSKGLKLFFAQKKIYSLIIILIAFTSQFLYLLLTPFSFKALGLNFPVREILLTQIAVQFTASIGATPGGIGIMDAAFAAFFKPYAPHHVAQLTFLYRFFSFYLPTLIGGLYFYKLLREEKQISNKP